MSQTNTIGRCATVITRTSEQTVVRYHATDVVTFSARIIMLNTGGWFTATTKARMNQASNQFNLGYQVYRKNFKWFVDYDGETFEFLGNLLTLTRRI